ncbi:MAG TPA: hypothetical protein VKS82_01430 [Streptosporangiaceae bacterium]|nr:hypothetical protein [Streptosporangiaceae bacterium]
MLAIALTGSSSSIASQVEPGVLGFLIVFAMAVALYFLIRSMNKQLRKVGADKRTFTGSGEEKAELPSKTSRRES